MKTYSQKPADVTRNWHIIDAAQLPLGRLSTEVARLLTGKHKPTFTPHTDGGDFVVIVNAANVALTGGKETAKKYYRHSGYPGSIKEQTAEVVRNTNPERLIEKAVFGMLPKNKLRDARMERLKVYAGSEHKHTAQKPTEYKIGAK